MLESGARQIYSFLVDGSSGHTHMCTNTCMNIIHAQDTCVHTPPNTHIYTRIIQECRQMHIRTHTQNSHTHTHTSNSGGSILLTVPSD